MFGLAVPVYAGFFSFLGSFLGISGKEMYIKTINSQNMGLLEAARHYDPNPSKGGGNITIVDESALMLDGAISPIHAIQRADVKLGNTVVVIGQGPTGLSIAQIAKIAGAGKVIVSDIFKEKLNVARKIGAADEIINVKNEDPVKRIMKSTEGEGADIVIEAVGTSEALIQALITRRVAESGKEKIAKRLVAKIEQFFEEGDTNN